jgi:hypothetical protein
MATRDLDRLDPRLLAGSPGPEGGPRWRAVLGWLRDAFVEHAALKFVALVLSLTVFVLVHSDEEAVATATVEVSYTLPPGKVLLSEPVEQIRITVKGSRRRIRRFDPAELGRVNIDLRGRPEGELVFAPAMIEDLPEGIELVSLAPPSMMVRLGDRAERVVPVVVATTGVPARGYHVTRLEADPAQVTLTGTSEAVARLDAARTAAVPIEGKRTDLVEEVALAELPAGTAASAQRVKVTIGFGEEQGVRQIGPVPVLVRPGPGVDPAAAARLIIDPPTVTIVLRGGVLELERVVDDGYQAVIRPGVGELGSERELEVRAVPARAGIGVEVRPPVVTVRGRP